MKQYSNSSLILVRVFSFALMLTLSSMLVEKTFYLIFVTILFAHYILQFIFTTNPLSGLRLVEKVGGGINFRSFFLRILFLGTVLYLFIKIKFFDIPFSFGIHFIFTEVYAKEFFQKNFKLRIFHYITSASMYCFYLMKYYPFNLLPGNTYLVFFILGILGLIYFFIKTKEESQKNLGFLIMYEIIGFLFLYFAPTNSERTFNIIFYHLIWWMIYPFFFLKGSLTRISGKLNLKYVTTTLVVTGIVGALILFNDAIYLFVRIHGNTFGSIHILTSLFLSRQNPEWINQLFLKKN